MAYHPNSAHRATRDSRKVIIKLTCGCSVKARHSPRHDSNKFGCTTGQAHGYQLGWTEWEDTGTGATGRNRNS